MHRLLHNFLDKNHAYRESRCLLTPRAHKELDDITLLIIMAISEACGGAYQMYLDSVVHYADLTMRVSMLKTLTLARPGCWRQAKELAQYA